MTLRTNRRRTLLRRTVYALTIVMLAAIPLSIWKDAVVFVETGTGSSGRSSKISLVSSNAVVMINIWSVEPEEPIERPIRVTLTTRYGAAPPAWYRPPRSRPGYLTLPMAYPAALLLACSIWLLAVHRRTHHAGRCTVCGYHLIGLESPNCPECGDTIGQQP